MKARAPKGQARATLDDLDGAVAGLLCLTGGADGPLTPDLLAGRRAAARATLERLVAESSAGTGSTWSSSGTARARASS